MYKYKLLQKSFQMFIGPRSIFPNKTIFTKYWLTLWIPKLNRSFEILWIRQYLLNFMGLEGIVNVNVYKATTNFHRSQAWQIVRIFNTVTIYSNTWLKAFC